MNEHRPYNRPAFVELETTGGEAVIFAASLVCLIEPAFDHKGRACSRVHLTGRPDHLEHMIAGTPRRVALALTSTVPGYVHSWTAAELAAFDPQREKHETLDVVRTPGASPS